MIGRYVWRDLRRNPRRSLTALAGMTLGIGLFSAVLFFIDGSSATMTARAIAPIPIDMQRVLADPLGNQGAPHPAHHSVAAPTRPARARHACLGEQQFPSRQ